MHKEVWRYINSFCVFCGEVQGDNVEINRHVLVCALNSVGQVYDPWQWAREYFHGDEIELVQFFSDFTHCTSCDAYFVASAQLCTES